MNNFIFENATKAVFGQGCVKEYLSCMVSHYGPNVLLAYGGGSIKRNGIYDEVCGILQSTDKNIVEFSGIMPNPTYAKVQEGAKLVRGNHIDLIDRGGKRTPCLLCRPQRAADHRLPVQGAVRRASPIRGGSRPSRSPA